MSKLKVGDKEQSTLVVDVGKPVRSNAKLTPAKRKKWLASYLQTKNKTKSCKEVGISHRSINELQKRDPQFNQAVKDVEQAFGHYLEEISLDLASNPTREGFQDRKLQLMRIFPEKYNPKPNIQINTQVNIENPTKEARSILDEIEVIKE